MGNTTSGHANNFEKHKRLGQVHVHTEVDDHQNIQQLMTVKQVVNSEREFNSWRKQFNRIQDSVTRQVLLLPVMTTYQSEGICGSTGIVQVSFEHYPYVFQSQIQNRKRIHRFFLQTELWYLLYTMVRAGSKFEKYHSKIGDVHPTNILINSDGLIKLLATCSLPYQMSNFDKLVDNPHSQVYLAPQQLAQHSIQRGQYPKNIDPSSAECFSIGLVMLTAGTLEDLQSIYCMEQGQRRVQRHKINYFLKIFGERYSSYLHSTVIGLLSQNSFQRKKCSQIYSALYEYQERILCLESFMPNHSRLTPFLAQQQGQPVRITHRQTPNIQYSSQVLANPIESTYIRAYPSQAGSHQSAVRSVSGGLSSGLYREGPPGVTQSSFRILQ